MFCGSCGREVQAWKHYCPFCGNRLAVPGPAPVSYGDNAGTATRLQDVQADKKGLNTRLVATAAVLIILAVTAGVVYSAFLRPPGTPGNGSSNNNSTGTNGNGSNSNGNNPPTLARYQAVAGRDAKYGNQAAFSIMVPQGWTGLAAVERYQYPFGGADYNFTARDSSGKMTIFFNSGDEPVYLEPQNNFQGSNCAAWNPSYLRFVSVQCAENTWWLPNFYIGAHAFIYRYLSATDYIQSVTNGYIKNNANPKSNSDMALVNNRALWPIMTSVHSDVKIERILDDPKLSNRAITITGAQTSGADALFSYTINGEQYKYLLQVLIVRITILGLSEWTSFVWGYSAPANNFDRTGNVFSTTLPTVNVNVQWLQGEIARQSQANAMIYQHTIRMQQMQYSMFQSQEQSMFTSGQGWIDALGGVKQIVNPSDPQDTYKVPLDYKYYWYCGGSADPFVGTNNSLYNPTGCTLYPDKT